ncbi:hypothetical protein F5B17DRAFT_426830 [Nemania serpens]|nr:hypothetical protein F5B17DRAFT_426830 [Nemania serpens]
MSQKITAKNLTYDSSLPPFLARLRGQQSARSGGPDPILAANRRPGQKRSASEEAEDAPVVVDEHGNVVYLENGQLEGEGEGDSSLQDGKEKAEGTRTSGETHNDEAGNEENIALEKEKERERVAGIGAVRKRKVGRVIGEEHSDDENNNDKEKTDRSRIAKASDDMRRLLREDEDTGRTSARKSDAKSKLPPPPQQKQQQQQQDEPQQQKTIKSAKKKAAKKIKLSFGDD